mmetsp:Transcript_27668/g.76541  ORF Transcript_27668/g.76541 Transcript_27668/m.76541 type:complete len:320 (+) Transcript_27668:2128-3087(+)
MPSLAGMQQYVPGLNAQRLRLVRLVFPFHIHLLLIFVRNALRMSGLAFRGIAFVNALVRPFLLVSFCNRLAQRHVQSPVLRAFQEQVSNLEPQCFVVFAIILVKVPLLLQLLQRNGQAAIDCRLQQQGAGLQPQSFPFLLRLLLLSHLPHHSVEAPIPTRLHQRVAHLEAQLVGTSIFDLRQRAVQASIHGRPKQQVPRLASPVFRLSHGICHITLLQCQLEASVLGGKQKRVPGFASEGFMLHAMLIAIGRIRIPILLILHQLGGSLFGFGTAAGTLVKLNAFEHCLTDSCLYCLAGKITSHGSVVHRVQVLLFLVVE